MAKKQNKQAKGNSGGNRKQPENFVQPATENAGAAAENAVTSELPATLPANNNEPALPANTEQAMTEQNQDQAQESKGLEITFNRNDATRRSNMVVFQADGHRGSVRVSKSLFTKDNVPATLTLAHPNFRPKTVPRSAMTAEERKAARKAQPKLTPAEKVANAEKRLEALRKQAEKAAAKGNTAQGTEGQAAAPAM